MTTTGSAQPRRSQLAATQARAGYVFLAPSFLLYALLVLLPVAVTVALSFARYDFVNGGRWVGLDNYLRLLADPRFLVVLGNTFRFTFFAVILNVTVGLLLALALNRRMPDWLLYFFRLAFFLPVIIAASFVAVVWSYLLGDDLGVVNFFLSQLGFSSIRWLSSSDWAMTAIIIVDVWKNTGFFMIIFIAALQGIPKPIMDAAVMDGATPWRRFWRITFPFISPVIFFNIVFASIGAMQVYETIFIMTRGGPGDATRSVTIFLTEQAFGAFEFGYGASVSVVLMLIILCITVVQFASQRFWVR
jgi:multiple sugar transport system permease protein